MNTALNLTNKSDQMENGQDRFSKRHIGPTEADISAMLKEVGAKSVNDFISKVVPRSIALNSPFTMSTFGQEVSEMDLLAELKALSQENKVYRSYIGTGYYGTFTPPVILRNILENPGWYTQYTPYQPEISQGRLEALLNFQTMIIDLTGLDIANASLLDEATAAAEAMSVSHALNAKEGASAKSFFVSQDCHPQTVAVVKTRAEALGLTVVVGNHLNFKPGPDFFGALIQYPTTYGTVYDYKEFIGAAHQAGVLVTVAADLLALVLLVPPGELGADIVVGSAQRFGVPMGFGGPHAAFFATKDEYKRLMPGRLVGVSKDSHGQPAIRLALQTREQHIRREKATSNICTAQVLLAVMASMYAVYHGPQGLKRIAARVHELALRLGANLKAAGQTLGSESFFDTVWVKLDPSQVASVVKKAEAQKINLRVCSDGITISVDETTSENDIQDLVEIITGSKPKHIVAPMDGALPLRSSTVLSHPVFNQYHSETEFLRYLRRLESRDLSLGVSMIPLGSCTMKLNATTEMLPVTWPEFCNLHPFAPLAQAAGYLELFKRLEQALCEITGFSAVSLQPNAGSQGEYAGLLAIRAYHHSRNDHKRDVCLIPVSAHGTNPASAVMAGMKVVVVSCDQNGNVNLADLKAKAKEYAETLSCLMVTYPSTHGVFESEIKAICDAVHQFGGQVYMDGANLNAQVGLCKPAEIGADVCHINLHKTFCIPHGGGGPGMGPIGVKSHLAPFLPGHPVVALGKSTSPVSAAPWGSATILTISYAYMALMGADGLRQASEIAILNANYLAKKLDSHYPVLYRGENGFVAHECILDLRELKKTSGVEVEDVAKRLMDYGFHAPTISFPVPGTIMIEPTESESKRELDRFCEALILIRAEIALIESGQISRTDNPLKNAPHTALAVTSDSWTHPYSREVAAFPASWTKEYKFWPAVGRIDGAYGDKNLICSCPGLESYS